jgi:2-polyprenyl-6-methoxyphenol hydroxylase-like FAD-dependent oxidoreductase
MPDTRTHAVVLGASIAGLAAARVLSAHFDRVTLIERDRLNGAQALAESRKGVPQGSQGHGILTSGYRLLERYFPGLVDELVVAGAQRADTTGDFLWYQFGGWKLRADSGLEGLVVSRPLLDLHVLGRVRALANVQVLDGYEGLEPILDRDRVRGLRVRACVTRRELAIDADLVLDASGRASRAPKWLSEMGFGRVGESIVKVDVGYASAYFERRPGDLYGARGAMIAGTPPQSTRSAALFGVERDRWLVTLVGAQRDYPPSDRGTFCRFARSLPTPEVYELIADREPLGPIARFRFPANRRLHFERLQRFPEGFLLLGDSLCCFNPMYGQGVAVAMIEAEALDACLLDGREDLAPRFLRRAVKLIDIPWTVTTGEDRRYASAGARGPHTALLHQYVERVHYAARRDPVVLQRFFEVVTMLSAPSAMLSPGFMWRVLRGGSGDSPGAPAPTVKRCR